MAGVVSPRDTGMPTFPDEERPEGVEDGGEDSIQVCIRMRPLVEKEITEGSDRIDWQFNDTSIIGDSDIGRKAFTFDRIFGPNESNAEVYLSCARPIVTKALQGYNGTVFAYGQTGTAFLSGSRYP
jgi:centromeric protein E